MYTTSRKTSDNTEVRSETLDELVSRLVLVAKVVVAVINLKDGIRMKAFEKRGPPLEGFLALFTKRLECERYPGDKLVV